MKEIKIPELAESITEGTIAKWLVQEGDAVGRGDPVAELETDKVNLELDSEFAGILAKIVAKEGEDVAVGDTIAMISDEASEAAAPAQQSARDTDEQKADDTAQTGKQGRESSRPATPSARKRARELGISLEDADLRFGPIRRDHVESMEKQTEHAKPVEQEETKRAYDNDSERPQELVKMSRRRQTIAKRLVEAQQNAAMLTTFNEIDLTEIIALRNARKEQFQEKHGIKLGFMSFFTKGVVAALKEFPLLNAEIEGNELIVKKYYDIGIAVSADDGLVVPVVRNADQLDFAGIEREISKLSKKARNNELNLQDLQGGTFTITNGGVFGSLLSTPILNAPQVGILGMHTIQKRPVVLPDGQIEARPMMYVALSYDHRIVDGKEAVQFLVRLKSLLEDPYDLLLEG